MPELADLLVEGQRRRREQGDAARGSGFQRVGAYQNGFVNGIAACETYTQ